MQSKTTQGDIYMLVYRGLSKGYVERRQCDVAQCRRRAIGVYDLKGTTVQAAFCGEHVQTENYRIAAIGGK